MKLRHAPLLVVREMARHETHRAVWSPTTLVRVIQRPDELTELARDLLGGCAGAAAAAQAPAVSAQVKKGLAQGA